MTPCSALCVINFNGESHLSRSLPAVGAIRDQFASLLLVDNSSTDDSVRFVREQFPFMQILELAPRIGVQVRHATRACAIWRASRFSSQTAT
jgi:hypothetical protein